MKYPYIGETERGSVVLFYKESTGVVLKHIGKIPVGKVDDDWCEEKFNNITHEYLINTYGKVESQEHAEFIVELAESNGFDIGIRSSAPSVFEFSGILLNMYSSKISNFAHNVESRPITIPMPPKESSPTATKDIDANITITDATLTVNDCVVDRDFHPTPLNNGDNLMFGGEDKFKEWPKIGDYVALRYRFDSKQIIHKGELLYLSDNHIIIKLESGNDYHCIRGEWDIEKPKTPEEEFIYDVAHLFRTKHDYLCFADELLSKYNITKKPQ